ncbi:hypothetical protein CMEL01_16734 [Colletotrichum melonis]|uniref:Uncharacterized protein n=1 Tax=Colletotrichum melonis TaxID=1209925 RepID=A0AAI9UCF5_9PEZI|nr:hypothetical protein CMEL01_16734 [Colletotrichum melonis]
MAKTPYEQPAETEDALHAGPTTPAAVSPSTPGSCVPEPWRAAAARLARPPFTTTRAAFFGGASVRGPEGADDTHRSLSTAQKDPLLHTAFVVVDARRRVPRRPPYRDLMQQLMKPCIGFRHLDNDARQATEFDATLFLRTLLPAHFDFQEDTDIIQVMLCKSGEVTWRGVFRDEGGFRIAMRDILLQAASNVHTEHDSRDLQVFWEIVDRAVFSQNPPPYWWDTGAVSGGDLQTPTSALTSPQPAVRGGRNPFW